MDEFEPKELVNDGLFSIDVKSHSLEKYRLVNFYSHVFTIAMRKKWQNLCFVDLFSGPGLAKISELNKFVEAPPLTVTRQHVKFDRYIFCDLHKESIQALEERVKGTSASSCAHYHSGDCNEIVEEIARSLPRFSKSNRGLTLCYVDPFGISNLKFNTLRYLSRFRVDFLVLLPTGMDAKRNIRAYYSKPDNYILDEFLGNDEWRKRFFPETPGWDDAKFFLEEFMLSMEGLGYRRPSPTDMVEVRHPEKKVLLYHLALFSKVELGEKFWKAGVKSTNPQQRLFD